MSTPKVTVIIPSYNYRKYIQAAIESVLKQTYQSIEVIVIDDGSTDGSVEFVKKKFAQQVRLIGLKHRGVAAVRNRGIKEARGEFYMYLDADDKLEKTYVAECLDMLEQHPEADYCYTPTRSFGDSTEVHESIDFDPVSLVMSGPYIHAGALTRRAKVGSARFRELPALEDWDFFLQLLRQGSQGVRLARPLYLWRQHGISRGRHEDIQKVIRDIRADYPDLVARYRLVWMKRRVGALSRAALRKITRKATQ